MLLKGSTGAPCDPVAETLYSQHRGPGSTPGWGTRSHMPQLKIRKTDRERKKRKKETAALPAQLDPLNRLPSAVTSYRNRHRNHREG